MSREWFASHRAPKVRRAAGNTYTLTTTGRCPVDPAVLDRYEVTVESAEMVRVEDILAAVAHLTARPVFQERFTAALAACVGARVTTVGYHSGVRTTSVAG